jgi:hypothetical protein
MIGSNLVGGKLTLKLGNGTNTLRMLGGNYGGISYTGGTGNDQTRFDQMSVFGAMGVALGTAPGLQTVQMGTTDFVPITIHGNLSVKATSGLTNVALRRTDLLGNLTLVTGAGNDTIGFDDFNVGGTASVQSGAGIDGIGVDNITQDGVGVLGNITTFGGAVKLDGGADNDNVNLSFNGGDFIRFGSTLTLIGGAGQDSYGNTAFNEFLKPGNKVLLNETVNGIAIPA